MVSRLTIEASATDRPKETGMLAIWSGLTMSSNHTVEKPTIGKVTPPCRPWKDRVYMTSIGP